VYTDSQSSVAHKPVFKAIESVNYVNRTTVRIALSEPIFRAFGQMDFKIIPEHLFRSINDYFDVSNGFRNAPVGSGPYTFGRRMSDGSEYMFVTNGEYHRETPSIKRIKRRKFLNQNSITNDLRSTKMGSVDVVPSVRIIDIPKLDKLEYLTLHSYNPLSVAFFGYNQKRGILKDVRVRKALTLATDRAGILASNFQDHGEVITGPFPPTSWAYDVTVEAYPYSPEEAEKLLRQAGYRDIDEDEWLEGADGSELELWIKVHNEIPYSERSACTDYVKNLQEIGVRARIDWREWHAWKKEVQEGDFDIVYQSLSYDDTCDIYPYFYSEGDRNYISYSNPRVDVLLKRSRTEIDPDSMRRIYQEAHRIVHDDCACTFLWSLTKYAGVKKRITGFKAHPFYFFTFVNEWQIQ